jgi:hypothetical protein
MYSGRSLLAFRGKTYLHLQGPRVNPANKQSK